MMSNEKVAYVQKQTVITADQVATLVQYVRDNCKSEMWKDVFLTELSVIQRRLCMINQMCIDSLVAKKAG